MSTNYYAITNHCECCERYDERHVAKFSAGWRPLLHAYPDDLPLLRSWAEIRDWMLSGDADHVMNEYGEVSAPSEFVTRVESRQGLDLGDHARAYPHESAYLDDDEGYNMAEGEWS